MEESFFKIFGVSTTLRKSLKLTSRLEIVLAGFCFVFALFCFFMFVCFLGYHRFGKPIIDFFGINHQSNFFFTSSVLMGIFFLVLGMFAIHSGVKSKICAENPVSILKAQNAFLTVAIVYSVFIAICSFLFYLSTALWIFIVLNVICLCFLAIIYYLKLIIFKNIPNKSQVVDILDFQNLSETEKQSVLKQSNTKIKKKS